LAGSISAVEEIKHMEERLQVSETLRGAHPLVLQTLHALEHVELNANGILQRPKQDSLDVVVSRGMTGS